MSAVSVLGIDAAWTARQPSGVALAQSDGRDWRLLAVAASYSAYFNGMTPQDPASARALIEASQARSGVYPAVVAVDMPLAHAPITARREADNAVSRAYGARHCSTHTPSAVRPGQISDNLREGFQAEGYRLATDRLETPALIEVYPHPALVELTGAARRLPYKVARARKYWPELAPWARRSTLLATWAEILAALDTKIVGVSAALPMPPSTASGRILKAFEDQLDAVVCAWVGICALEGRARPYGDKAAAIWIPSALNFAKESA